MNSRHFFSLGIGLIGLLLVSGAGAEEKAEQLIRDAARLEQIKTISLLPIVTQVRFDQDGRLPDPSRVAARVAAMMRLPSMLEDRLKSGKFTILPPEAASLAVKEMKWQPTDLYITTNAANWDAPAEEIKNKKGDEAVLLNKRVDMKKTPEEMTLFRYRWHDLPETNIGLASFKMAAFAHPVMDKIKTLSAKLGADALLLCQVTEMETHEGTAGLFSTPFKTTRIHLHFTLIASKDGAIIWQARAKGLKSQQAGYFTGERAYKGEDRKVIEATAQALDILLADLLKATGKPVNH